MGSTGLPPKAVKCGPEAPNTRHLDYGTVRLTLADTTVASIAHLAR
jgi:hypothetical protein